MTSPRSTLAHFAPLCREADPALGRAACKQVWHETGLIVINPAHLGWAQATRACQMATELYGKRTPR